MSGAVDFYLRRPEGGGAVLSRLDAQWVFATRLAQFVQEVSGRGLRVIPVEVGVQPTRRTALPYLVQDRVHKDGSLHYDRRAADANLYRRGADGRWLYVSDGADPLWQELGLFWESLHLNCRWGGRIVNPRPDANHLAVVMRPEENF